VIRNQRVNFEELKMVYENVSMKMDQLREENIGLVKEIQQKSADDEENIEIWETERATLVENANSYKSEIDLLQNSYNQLKKQYNDLKIEKLKIEESKR
jgi:uncharacterized protein (DUF3084 family)